MPRGLRGRRLPWQILPAEQACMDKARISVLALCLVLLVIMDLEF